MKIKFGVYENPPAPGGEETSYQLHGRIISKGTFRLSDLCDNLRELGVNSAQVKAVLDATGRFIRQSLTDGYNVELDGIGTFSLSLRSQLMEEEHEEEAEEVKKTTRLTVDRINFKSNRRLLEQINRNMELMKITPNQAVPSFVYRKQRLLNHLKKTGFISERKYAGLNNCSRYQSRKDLSVFEQEGLVVRKGSGTHKMYVLAEE
ncbi:putative histone-like DNA-binding protein [Parabacteroides sp. PFB2-10]|uniref:HU family DNA-binding protein n=1 Tax=Parabacteroides sp. PFB2-10 TaxID=1742405 RepID=UPI00247544E2|nr:HU family DNA-binding protein [Parabacteroides sp. PFB2-10]MDH6313427.1 putative histone-like DNA-binding protein [Parabacteroides sp. PFB2-10]